VADFAHERMPIAFVSGLQPVLSAGQNRCVKKFEVQLTAFS